MAESKPITITITSPKIKQTSPYDELLRPRDIQGIREARVKVGLEVFQQTQSIIAELRESEKPNSSKEDTAKRIPEEAIEEYEQVTDSLYSLDRHPLKNIGTLASRLRFSPEKIDKALAVALQDSELF